MERKGELAEKGVVAGIPGDVHLVASRIQAAREHVEARDVRERDRFRDEQNAVTRRWHGRYLLKMPRPTIWIFPAASAVPST